VHVALYGDSNTPGLIQLFEQLVAERMGKTGNTIISDGSRKKSALEIMAERKSRKENSLTKWASAEKANFQN
jgi:hypothetical protein